MNSARIGIVEAGAYAPASSITAAEIARRSGIPEQERAYGNVSR
jgi:3-hydroxy-3-methylglutaryl CoA synthase